MTGDQLSPLPVGLSFDLATGIINAGPFQGQDVEEISERIAMGHVMAGRAVYRTVEIRRLWWKPWQQTSVLRVSVISERAAFQQAFDDGGPR